MSADTTNAHLHLWARTTETFTNAVFKYQLISGSTADYDFEPYVGGTAAPNPDYPQDVQVVTGEQTVKVTGKNLFDINNRNAIGGYFDGSQAVSTIVIGTAGRNRIIYIPCEPSTTYSFSFADLTDMNSPQVGTTTETPDSGVTVNRLGVISSSTLKLENSTTPSDAKYIVVRFQTKYTSVDISTALENCLSKFQIEQSQTATDYEAYQSQEYELDLFDNLYDKDSAVKSGSDIHLDISVQPNTTYIFNTGKAWTGAFLYDSNDTQTRTVGNDASLTHSVEFTTAANEVKARLTFYGGPSFDIETYDFSHIFFYVKNLIELCKIGDYQDYIYKSNGDWYKHEVIKKTTLPTSGYTRWSTQPTACMYYKNGALSDALLQTGAITAVIENLPVMPQVANMTEYYNTYAQVNKYGFVLKTDTPGIMIQNTDQTAVADFHTWIAANPIEVRYVLATPVDTQITNEALIEQLGALSNTNSYRDTTHIDTASDGENLPVIIAATATGKADGTVTNAGNTYAKPKLTIYGTGTIGVYLNGSQMFQIELGSEGHITIDTEKMEAYKDSESNLKNRLVTGDYSKFRLEAGENRIDFSGNINKCVVENYTRWL